MQYAYARVRSIFRKGGHPGTAGVPWPDGEAEDHRADAGPIPLAAPEELALGKMLLQFPETLDRALEGYQPNVLAAYLYDLAQAFTAFYEACPVLKSEEAVRQARLRLCDLVARTIAKGLDLLGIEVADRM
jgi:arginyl-tRNA synthetase